jgi:perosamine synthetase
MELIPWFGPEVGAREKELVAQVIDSGYINDGKVTRDFEARIAKIAGTAYAVAYTSGTVSISMALHALGIGPGDEVLVPDLTFIATANAVRLIGANVKLVDVERYRLTMDVAAAEAAIGPKTRAVVPVDVNGRGANYRALEAMCKKHGLKLVCDSAEALASQYDGRPLGSYGDAGCFSFSANKTVSTGQGGCVVTNDAALAQRLRELKDQGRRRQGSGGDDLHPVMGFNFKFTNVQAAIGLAQIERMETRLAQATKRDAWYTELLGQVEGLEFPDYESQKGEVRQWTDVLVDDRAKVETALKEKQIGSRNFWFPLHTQDPYAGLGGEFPRAMSISARGMWLPSHFALTQSEAERTADVVKKALRC